MDGGRHAYTRARTYVHVHTLTTRARIHHFVRLVARRLAPLEMIAAEARPELGLCPLCLENDGRVDRSSPSGLAGPDEKDERARARPTFFPSRAFCETRRDRASQARFQFWHNTVAVDCRGTQRGNAAPRIALAWPSIRSRE